MAEPQKSCPEPGSSLSGKPTNVPRSNKEAQEKARLEEQITTGPRLALITVAFIGAMFLVALVGCCPDDLCVPILKFKCIGSHDNCHGRT
jgi:hypothetical protein